MLVVNLFGAPSSGKTTVAAGLFYLMKLNRFKVEMIREVAKDLVYQERSKELSYQSIIMGKQGFSQYSLIESVDYLITDSPILLSPFYARYHNQLYGINEIEALAKVEFDRYENLNFLFEPEHAFEKLGRRHDEEECKIIRKKLPEYLEAFGITYERIIPNPATPTLILEKILNLNKKPVLENQLTSWFDERHLKDYGVTNGK